MVAKLLQDNTVTRRLTDVGEVIFNTAMTGYVEVLTDPSYTGQIVVMTYPHIGNYGVDPEWSERFSSGGVGDVGLYGGRPVAPAAFIVRQVYRGPVPRNRIDLHSFLREHSVPGISGVDTRALTLHLREQGALNGVILKAADGDRNLSESERKAAIELLKSFPAMEGRNLVSEVGIVSPVHIEGSGPHVVLYDCGVKANILRELQKFEAAITVVPNGSSAEEILAENPDMVFLSNGPGDPAELAWQVEQTRKLIGRVSLRGICLGHQLLAEALGGRTYKMKFGHHGINHPVRDEITGRVYITSQNHGFAVDEESLPPRIEVWLRNSNDSTVEGFRDREHDVITTQFHPESAPGPDDAERIFDIFVNGFPRGSN